MELHYTPTSPYARKVRVVIEEKGLGERVRLVHSSPLEPDVVTGNPLHKVPALKLEDGRWLFDSPLLCAYLDALDGAPTLSVHSVQTPFRWRAESLGDGVLDAAVAMVLEGRRADAEQSPYWRARREGAVMRAAAEMERTLSDAFDLGTISYVCALAYVTFRLPELPWRDHRELATWYDALSRRPSFEATRHVV